MKIERIAISKLTPDPNNARTHDQRNLDAIAGSLSEFGQRKPIVITQNNIIAAGNGTVEAAKSLGWTDIEAVRIPADWDADRIKAFALADNRSAELAQWDIGILDQQIEELRLIDFDMTAIGFDNHIQSQDVDWSGLGDAVKDKSDFEQMTFVLSEQQADMVRQAIAMAKQNKPIGDGINQNSNGNALHEIVKHYLEV
jgi:hypothetical protein